MRPTEGARKRPFGEDSLQLEALIEANLKSTKMALISIVEPLVHTLESLVHEIQVEILYRAKTNINNYLRTVIRSR
jgi:hypothetical protein